jgi:hypothetical protein
VRNNLHPIGMHLIKFIYPKIDLATQVLYYTDSLGKEI